MKVAVWKDIGILEVEEVAELQPRPDQVKVKIAYCGICGSDPHIVEGRLPVAGKPPRIIGHEASGTIVEVGSDARRYQGGQRVAVNYMAYCGACYYCRNGMEHFCQRPFFSAKCFAEYAVFKEESVFLLPDNISLEEGALTEPISVTLHAIDVANIHPGSSVAIFGAGPIGLLLLQLAIRSGATRTLVSEPVAEKRELAKRLGADVVVDPFNEDLEQISKQLTESRGFDTILEASGSLTAAREAIFLVDNCGTVLWFAVYPLDGEIGVPPYYLYEKELTIRSIVRSPYTFPRAVALLTKLELKSLISDIIPLADISKAFDLHKEGKAVKILIRP